MRTVAAASFSLACLILPLAATAHAEDIDVWAGVGGGEYVFNTAVGEPKSIVPFQEIGVEARWSRSPSLTFGVQLAVRSDGEATVQPDPGGVPIGAIIGGVGIGGTPGGGGGGDPTQEVQVEAGQRWRLVPYVETHWRDLRLRGGAVLGTYYNVTQQDDAHLWVYPLFAAAVGNELFEIEFGLLDAPVVAASATGGLGVLALRVGLMLAPGHRVTVGAGAPYAGPGTPDGGVGGSTELGHFSYAYEADFEGQVSLRIGGYTSTDTNGLFASVGKTF